MASRSQDLERAPLTFVKVATKRGHPPPSTGRTHSFHHGLLFLCGGGDIKTMCPSVTKIIAYPFFSSSITQIKARCQHTKQIGTRGLVEGARPDEQSECYDQIGGYQFVMQPEKCQLKNKTSCVYYTLINVSEFQCSTNSFT